MLNPLSISAPTCRVHPASGFQELLHGQQVVRRALSCQRAHIDGNRRKIGAAHPEATRLALLTGRSLARLFFSISYGPQPSCLFCFLLYQTLGMS